MIQSKTKQVIPQVSLWNIFIPKYFNDGTYIPSTALDSYFNILTSISSGMTLFNVRGVYVNNNTTYTDENYSILVTTTKSQIEYLALKAKREFQQESVMYYKVSDDVYLV